MIKIEYDVDSLKKLDEYINYVNIFLGMKYNKDFQKFIQNKCLEVIKRITDERLIGGTTNDEFIDLYKSSHHLQETDDGFIIYNDAKIDVDENISINYPEGKFSIALAFEYGVGITGEGTYINDHFQPWEYNVNNYNFAWKYKKQDGQYDSTYGYMGFEIYRYSVIEINNKILSWLNEYYIERGKL